MDSRKFRILVVDDSAFMRRALTTMLTSDPQISVIDSARDGWEGVEKVKSLKPDLVTLDIEMPRMGGLEALKIIMKECPTPVLMVSSLTEEGAQATLEALSLGAMDFIPKNLNSLPGSISQIKSDLLLKVKKIAARRAIPLAAYPVVREPPSPSLPPFKSSIKGSRKIEVIALGTSTGGPKALQEVLSYLPPDMPVGGLIVQHMPDVFISPFAQRLNQLSQVTVKKAEEGDIIEKGLFLLSPGGIHLKVRRRIGNKAIVHLDEEPSSSLHRPSVDEMMLSVAHHYRGTALGVILTGMGQDGLKGMTAIKKGGGKTIAQNEESCVVYGMPKAVVEAQIADKVCPLSSIAGEIVNALSS